MKPLRSLLRPQHVSYGPYGALLVVVLAIAITVQYAGMHVPGIATPAQFTGTPPIFFALFIAFFIGVAWWLGPGNARNLWQDMAQVTRDVGLTTPTWPSSTGRRRLSLPLGAVLLLTAVVLTTGGQELLTHLYWKDLALIPRDQDWRYLAVHDAPEAAVVLMTLLNAPIPEELLYRGMPLALVLSLNRHAPHSRYLRSIITTIIIVSALAAFSTGHSESGALNVLTTAWSGTIYLAVTFLTRSLWIPIAIHFLHNLYVYSQWLDWWPS